MSALSHLRRINTPVDKSGKLIPPRKLHNSSFGYICPAETPEGGSVGIVKNLTYLSQITNYSNSAIIYHYLDREIIWLEDIECRNIDSLTKIFINGNWCGCSENSIEVFYKLKELKYKGIINIYISISFNYSDNAIIISTDAGRLVRPLLRVKNNKILMYDYIDKIKSDTLDWDHLFTNQYLDESILE